MTRAFEAFFTAIGIFLKLIVALAAGAVAMGVIVYLVVGAWVLWAPLGVVTATVAVVGLFIAFEWARGNV